jgi:A/G-specific adenine glycosylase
MPSSPLHQPLLTWYAAHARDLPWRRPGTTPWGVLVSEVMLQQTPVARVAPAWEAWIARWPAPAALAAEPAGEAVRQWARLGYPRRALRLHAAAGACVERFAGLVPTTYEDLRSLPGVGDYTAAAVLAFAHGRRAVVLDTNVRRVLARAVDGSALPRPTVTRAERALAESVLPDPDDVAARWSVAVMELGALVCTAADPGCAGCPIAGSCTWLAAGRPAYDGPAHPVQRFAGTDRQVRGLLLSVLRETDGPVPKARLDAVWDDATQRERALDSLVADGLVDPVADGCFRLPGHGARIEG